MVVVNNKQTDMKTHYNKKMDFFDATIKSNEKIVKNNSKIMLQNTKLLYVIIVVAIAGIGILFYSS